MAKSTSMTGMIDTVGEWFAKLPALPKGGREFLVTITPWIALIFGGLGVLFGILALIGSSTLLPFTTMAGANVGGGMIALVLGVASSALLLAAFPGTKNRKAGGWNFLFYSEAVSLLAQIVSISIFGIVVAAIGFYIIFQIRSYYK